MAPRERNFHNGVMPVDKVKAGQQAYVRELCGALGVTPTELARRAGLAPATLTRFMNDPRYKHALGAKTLHKIADVTAHTGIRPPLSGGTTPLPHMVEAPTVKVVGAAAAGLWKEVDLIQEGDFAQAEIPIVENHRYAGHTQYALLVEGNSMNKQFRSGEYVICVAWAELGVDLRDGQYVHVERTHGGLHEVTVKKVRLVEGQTELWPESDDPRFQTPIDLAHADEDTEVRIRGLVIGSFRHLG